MRQLKRYYRSKARIIGSLAQPLLFLIAFGFGFGPVFEKAGAGNYMQFLVPGIIAMSILFTAIFSGIELIWDKQFGFLKETLVAPKPRYKIFIGRTIGGATISFLQGIIVLCISFAFGFRIYSLIGVILALLFMFLIALFFTALGTAIASVLDDMQGFHLIMNFLVMPIFFLSGALFPIESLPKGLYIVTRLNPMTYGVDGVRHALVNISGFGVLLDIAVLVALNIALILIGTKLFSRMEV